MKFNIYIICFILLVIPNLQAQDSDQDVKAKGKRRIRQAEADVIKKSQGCLLCHKGIEKMHQSPAVKLGCTDCHGGNPFARTMEKAHVKPKFADVWRTSANPVRSFTISNKEKAEFIKFVNPGDLRVADETCGACHPQEVLKVKKSMMTTSTLLWGGAAYNNGIVSNKVYTFGESYSRDGVPQRINTVQLLAKVTVVMAFRSASTQCLCQLRMK